MNNIPASAIFEIEVLLEALYIDPSSDKKREAKIVYRPTSGSCLVQMHSEDEEPQSKQLRLDLFLFEKARQLGYLREVPKKETGIHQEYCLTDDIFTLAEINSIREGWLKIKKDREERIAKLAQQQSSPGE